MPLQIAVTLQIEVPVARSESKSKTVSSSFEENATRTRRQPDNLAEIDVFAVSRDVQIDFLAYQCGPVLEPSILYLSLLEKILVI